ncbi:MAG TPA: hypothetical protein EYP58_04390 [bacterium (Candidatus Stahlbacteria)]|nr:hypothetical protein [Candidatus Stahlbacteria bacterium]
MIRYERFLLREISSDSARLPKYTFSIVSPQLSFTYRPVASYDETTTVETSNAYNREHRRVNITEFIISMTSRTGNELTYTERIYLGLNLKFYSGNYFSVKATRINNEWQEPDETISSTFSPGLDAGLIFWYNKVSLGGMVEDVYTRMAWREAEAFTLKRKYRGALGIRPVNQLFLSGGIEYQEKWSAAGGTEILISSKDTGVALRGGIIYDFDSNKYYPSGGLGLHSPRVRIDGGIRYLNPGLFIAVAVSVTG